jgi:leucyl-tRNA synthetase
MEYNPSRIEAHWKKFWAENQTYKVENGGTKPKFYILNMFPYPSGAGLHVGHPLGYIATDIYARYKRLKGFNVLNPMGYDSFGLPAEQYAIQTGTHPALTTEKNIATFRGQLDNLGFSFDWSREVRTSDPSFYKWTQWIFMQLFNHYYDKDMDKSLTINELVSRFEKEGNTKINAVCDEDTPSVSAADWNKMSEKEQQLFLLKYRLTFPEESFVNWCKALGTVLSNDEVKDGVSERGGYPVERKLMKQWSMRITAYADKLLAGLDTVDWSDSLKEQQRNWIGRSQGASVKFPLALDPEVLIEVFTTRVDTIYGVSFMVLAPEHELVAHLTTKEQKSDIENYQKWAASRSDVERMSEVKKVSGAFTGSYCVNPFNGEKIQIWIADYVLAGYGTGAVMGVPSGDQRDWSFATHFNLPIVQILDNQKDIHIQADNTKEGKYINSGIINGLEYKEATAKLINWLEEKGLGKGKIQYRLRNAIFSRQRYWGEPVPAYWKDGGPYLIEESELPLVLPSIEKYLPTETGEPPLGRAEGWKYKDEYEYELSTMPGWAGSSWYFYRYMDAHNTSEFASKEALDYWQNVDIYVGGTEHAVGHLLYSRFWNHFMYDLGLIPQKEYAAKLINQGMIQGRSNFVYRAKERFFEAYLWIKVLEPLLSDLKPKRMAKSGLEEAITYDFSLEATDLAIEVVSLKNLDKIERKKGIAKADGKRLLILTNEELITDINNPEAIAKKIKAAAASKDSYILSTEKQPYEHLFVSYDLTKKYDKDAFTPLHVDVNIVENDILNLGKAKATMQFEKANFKVNTEGVFMCHWEVEKMSKSKYNVVNPDDMVSQYGADCFRMYEMFLGPLEDSKPWSTTGITGVQGFLRKLWSLFYDLNTGKNMLDNSEPTKEEYKALHKCIKKVSEDIERFSFNTCVSSFMICANELKDLKCHKPLILKELVTMVAPFAPFVAEELNSFLGNKTSVLENAFPTLNESYLVESEIVYPISINGKKRGEATFSADAKPADIEAEVRAMEVVKKWTEDDGKDIKKVIIVPGRMVNIVV